jgi:hypothetical protein
MAHPKEAWATAIAITKKIVLKFASSGGHRVHCFLFGGSPTFHDHSLLMDRKAMALCRPETKDTQMLGTSNVSSFNRAS